MTKKSEIVITGTVVRGKGRGKQLGYPTANILLTTTIDEGVYLSYATLRKTTYPSLTFVGAAKTFGEVTVLSETYILSKLTDFYNESLQVQLIKRMRPNMTFSSPASLIVQMKQDEMKAKEYFAILKKGI